MNKTETSKKKVKSKIQKYIYGRNRNHYLKWKLDYANDWSIRFFFNFDTRPQYNMTWVLKSHKEKHYIVLTKNEAIEYIQKYANRLEPEEIFALNEFGSGYRKLNVQPKGTSTYLDKLI
jgi:hypothetical protein